MRVAHGNGRSMMEAELKFLLDTTHVRAVQMALRRAGSAKMRLESHYFDTADHRLARAGLSLRLRKVGRRWEQTLKAPGTHPGERHEETVARSRPTGADMPTIDHLLHSGTAAGAALKRLLDSGEPHDAELLELHASHVTRQAAIIAVDGARIEVALDQGEIRAGSASESVCEVEYELKSGAPGALIGPASAGVQAYAMRVSTLSKAERGDRLSRAAGQQVAVKACPARIHRSMSAPAMLRAIVESCLEQVLANVSEMACGAPSDEQIHQLRVGLRRLRTAARELGALDPSMVVAWAPAVADAFRTLGDYRDRTTVAGSLERRLVAAGSPAARLAGSLSALPDPSVVIEAEPVQLALLELMAFLFDSPSGGVAGTRGARSVVDARLEKLHRQVLRGAKRFGEMDFPERHRLRKRLKRLRYLAELVEPLYARHRVKAYLARLEPAQDALGRYVDLAVGRRLAREQVGRGDEKSWFDVGWLTAQEETQAIQCRRVLRAAALANAFWNR